ncbi:MAG: hypothetical protein JXR23_04925 [Pontiellaceae bacterium]|nr:hypothetical protein [Pontiellaceae bacterium]
MNEIGKKAEERGLTAKNCHGLRIIGTAERKVIMLKIRILSLFLFIALFGCKSHCNTQDSIIISNGFQQASIPIPMSAETRLLEVTDFIAIDTIELLVYITGGDEEYLAIDGLFELSNDVVTSSVVLIKKYDDETWDKAKVCLFESYVEYINEDGVLEEAFIRDALDLFNLPGIAREKALKNVEEISSAEAFRLGMVINGGGFDNEPAGE